jgi:hypothetical protein
MLEGWRHFKPVTPAQASFVTSPAPLHALARDFWRAGFAPTATHRFVAELERRGALLHCFSRHAE